MLTKTDRSAGPSNTIVDPDDSGGFVLVWNESSSPVPEFAAEELHSYLGESLNTTIQRESAVAPDVEVGEAASVIVLLDEEAVAGQERHDGTVTIPDDWMSRIDAALAGQRPDAFAIQVTESAALCAGTTHRGTLYAVYSLLERHGVRFFAPNYPFYEDHAEYVPDARTVTLPAEDVSEQPDWSRRRKSGAPSHSPTTLVQLVDWMAKNRLNVLQFGRSVMDKLERAGDNEFQQTLLPELRKRGIEFAGGGHGFHHYLPKSEYGDEHPDWFVDGYNVFDVTQDAAVRTYVDNVLDYLEDRPEIDTFWAWPPDGASWPPVVPKEFGSIANAYAHVVNRLHDGIQDRFPDRDLKLQAIAYYTHIEPPDPEYMYDEDILIDFALYDRSYEVPIDDPESKNVYYADLLERWHEEFDGQLLLYEYYRKGSFHSLPVVLTELIGEDIPYYAAHGIDGILSYPVVADWITYELMHLLEAAVAWDTDLDTVAFRDAYLDERYGPIDDSMREYFELVEEAGRLLFDSANETGGNFKDEGSVTQALENYREAYHIVSRPRSMGALGHYAWTTRGQTAKFLLDRLAINAEYAIADLEISYYELQGEPAKRALAKERAAQLIHDNRFKGVIRQGNFSMNNRALQFDVPREAWQNEYWEEWEARNERIEHDPETRE